MNMLSLAATLSVGPTIRLQKMNYLAKIVLSKSYFYIVNKMLRIKVFKIKIIKIKVIEKDTPSHGLVRPSHYLSNFLSIFNTSFIFSEYYFTLHFFLILITHIKSFIGTDVLTFIKLTVRLY